MQKKPSREAIAKRGFFLHRLLLPSSWISFLSIHPFSPPCVTGFVAN